jgi:hypothetical protein
MAKQKERRNRKSNQQQSREEADKGKNWIREKRIRRKRIREKRITNKWRKRIKRGRQ